MQILTVLHSNPFSLSALLAQSGFALAFLGLSAFLWDERGSVWRRSVFLAGTVAAAAIYAVGRVEVAAWAALLGGWVWLGWMLRRWLALQSRAILRWSGALFLALAAASLPVLLAQMEAAFADEELFVPLQVAELAGVWLLLALGTRQALSGRQSAPGARPLPVEFAVLLGLGLLAGLTGIRAYQASFYPATAPGFPGISEQTPFLCTEAPPDSTAVNYTGEAVLAAISQLVEAKPNPGPPEFGLLALTTGEESWAQRFRESLLAEAQRGEFTGPAYSMKSYQYEAVLRLDAFYRVNRRFPGLFSADEAQQVSDWFARINQQALTAEPVDWMYALAFSKLPEGPYENQEIGAGLLALLEYTGLGDPALAAANQDYLQRNPRGWLQRWRNTDDALFYQPVWLTNAYFQSLYTGQAPSENLTRSLEWLLLQALPDGAPYTYNMPYPAPLAGALYLGAGWLDDPRYLWLAGRSTDYLSAHGGSLQAQSGLETALEMVGISPTVGSCLIYGGSGLPNQLGPLAPDKIVLRDGWTAGATYLLLNLRFSGWHRYKATNTISLLYQGGPLVTEPGSVQKSAWLPAGRSVVRDKRIRREDLNGLLVERSGLGRVLWRLTGAGGPWAQDPPYYARVERFETGAQVDLVQTALSGWHGWEHRRTIHFYKPGPVVVVDTASGPPGRQAALAWRLAEASQKAPDRFQLSGGSQPAELVLLPLQAGAPAGTSGIQADLDSQGNLAVQYQPPASGSLALVSVFLSGPWVGASVELAGQPGALQLQIRQGAEKIEIPLESLE